MKRLVLKFGGASVASPEKFGLIADLILNRLKEADQIVVVVSAMGNTTDELLSLARKVHPSPPKREQDMLISVGERISMSLLAMALELKGKQAVSFTGSQAGLITTTDHSEAHIIDVRPARTIRALDQGKIVIVAGF
jgi:aspartate kinase